MPPCSHFPSSSSSYIISCIVRTHINGRARARRTMHGSFPKHSIFSLFFSLSPQFVLPPEWCYKLLPHGKNNTCPGSHTSVYMYTVYMHLLVDKSAHLHTYINPPSHTVLELQEQAVKKSSQLQLSNISNCSARRPFISALSFSPR